MSEGPNFVLGAKIALLEHLFSSSLPMRTTTTKQQSCHIYVLNLHFMAEHWNICIKAINAPWKDMCLFKKCLKYIAGNPTVSKRAASSPISSSMVSAEMYTVW